MIDRMPIKDASPDLVRNAGWIDLAPERVLCVLNVPGTPWHVLSNVTRVPPSAPRTED